MATRFCFPKSLGNAYKKKKKNQPKKATPTDEKTQQTYANIARGLTGVGTPLTTNQVQSVFNSQAGKTISFEQMARLLVAQSVSSD